MILTSSSPSATTITGLFPELLGVGGVQESSRQSASALNEIARKRGWRLQILSFNDPPGEHYLPSDNQTRFRAFGRKKLSLAMLMVRTGIFSNRYNLHFVVAAHPNLALPAWLMKMFSRSTRLIVMTHGVEVWTRLPSLKLNALSHADLVLGPSADTVAQANRGARSRAGKDPEAGLAFKPAISLHGRIFCASSIAGGVPVWPHNSDCRSLGCLRALQRIRRSNPRNCDTASNPDRLASSSGRRRR